MSFNFWHKSKYLALLIFSLVISGLFLFSQINPSLAASNEATSQENKQDAKDNSKTKQAETKNTETKATNKETNTKEAEKQAPKSQNSANPLTSLFAKDEDTEDKEDSQDTSRTMLEHFLNNQKLLIKEAKNIVEVENKVFNSTFASLSDGLRPYESNYQELKLLSLSSNLPAELESVNRSLATISAKVSQLLEPAQNSCSILQNSIDSLANLTSSLDGNLASGEMGIEIKNMQKDIANTKKSLEKLLKRYDPLMLPAKKLLDNMNKTMTEITTQLPNAWKQHYFHGRENIFASEAWQNASKMLLRIPQFIHVRLPAELPVNQGEWQASLMRGLVVFILAFLLLHYVRRSCANIEKHQEILKHIFSISLIWFCAGFGFIASAIAQSNEVYRLLLGLGNVCLIIGQMFLAWDLRQIQLDKFSQQFSPIWWIMPPTLCAYIFLYLPLPQVIVLLLWLITLLVGLFSPKFTNKADILEKDALPGLEASILNGASIVLWICLVLTLCGLHIYSMILYLLYSSCALAIQLSVAAVSICHRFNENLLASEDTNGKSAILSIFLALAAPMIIILAVLAMSLWIATLPGGLVLILHYVLQGFSVGETQFSFLQILLIISAFFLTRTCVRMGTLFLERLPKRGVNIDPSLIAPTQTIFTYLIWGAFTIFVLRALGINLENIAVIAGGFSVGIGFGMQSIVNNFVSGLLLIFSRNMQVGDVVEVGGVTGTVRKIHVRTTTLITPDNATITIPNSELISNKMINWTHKNRTARRDIVVGVAYGSDVAKATELLLQAAKNTNNVLANPKPVVIFNDFGASSLDLILRFWVKDYNVALGAMSDVRVQIDQLFREQNIEIAFPQMDIHLVKTANIAE